MFINEKGQRVENVLLCNMSTLNNLKSSYYYAEEPDGHVFICDGVSQLEPGTKFLIYSLFRQGRSLDRIVVTCTDATLREDKRPEIDGRIAKDEYIKGVKCFLERCGKNYPDSFLGELKEKIQESEGLDSSKKSALMHITEKECFDEEVKNVIVGDLDNLFKIVEIEKAGIHSPETLGEISRNILGEADVVNVFMDVQGGDRSFMYILNSILALKGSEKVNVESAIFIDYMAKAPIHRIGDAIDVYKLNDFITAMKAFTNYGRGELLVDYFAQQKSITSDSEEAQLVKIISRISDAILISDPGALYKSIGELGEKIQSIERGVCRIDNPFLNLVLDDIKADYGKVLVPVENSFDEKKRIVDIIEWCLKKDFIQQSLTLIEDKMPAFYNNDDVIVFNFPDEDINIENRVRDSSVGAQWYESFENVKFYKTFSTIRGRELAVHKNLLFKKPIEAYVAKLVETNMHQLENNETVWEWVYKEYYGCAHAVPKFKIADLVRACALYIEDGNEQLKRGAEEVIEALTGMSTLEQRDCGEVDDRIRAWFAPYIFPNDDGKINTEYFAEKIDAIADKVRLKIKEGIALKANRKTEAFLKSMNVGFEQEDVISTTVRRYIFKEHKEIVLNAIKEAFSENGEEISRKKIYELILLKNINALLDATKPQKELNKNAKTIVEAIDGNGIGGANSKELSYGEMIDIIVSQYLEGNKNLLDEYIEVRDSTAISQENVDALYSGVQTAYDNNDNRKLLEYYWLFKDMAGKLERESAQAYRPIDEYCKYDFDNSDLLEQLAKYFGVLELDKNAGIKKNTIIDILDRECVIGSKKEPLSVKVSINETLKPYLKDIDLILKTHDALKKERNSSNHAAERGQRVKVSIIRRIMELYLEGCRNYVIAPIEALNSF